MSLNCAEIDLVLRELDLAGSFLQAVVQPSFDTIALTFYRGADSSSEGTSRTVLVCLAPGACRIHQTWRRVPRTEKPLRFMEFLRSRAKGARVVEAAQLGDNRIVRIVLSRGDERLLMYIRLWSGAANVVVTDAEGRILDVFYRRPKRGELTGLVFDLPDEGAASKTGAENQATAPARRYEVRDLAGEGSFNERIDGWYAEHAAVLSREALLAEARRRAEAREGRLRPALAKLERKRESFLDADRFRRQGDLLTANLYRVEHGATSVEVEDYENGNARIRIELDPRLKPQENAARYYERYRKAVSGLADLEDDIAATRRALETVALELAALEAETNPHVIQSALRRQARPRQQLERRYPGLVFRVDGWLLLVGRTAAENDELLRRHVRGQDLWLHARDWPGGYVFVKNRPGKTVPLEILLDAGTLALFYSKGRKAGSGDLYYTQVKHLRRAKGAKRGTVLPSNEKNLSVKIDEARLKRLETCRDEDA